MNSYENATRGTYQNKDYGRQLVSFEGMRYQGSTGLMNVTPTDIDGFIQLNKEDIFIFFELKHGKTFIPFGQAEALTKLVDELNDKAILFVASHGCENGEDIIAAETIVSRFYWNKQWTYVSSGTLNEWINRFITFKQKKEETA